MKQRLTIRTIDQEATAIAQATRQMISETCGRLPSLNRWANLALRNVQTYERSREAV